MMSDLKNKSFVKKIFVIEKIINSCARIFKSRFEFVVMFNLYKENGLHLKHSYVKARLSDKVDNSPILYSFLAAEISRKLEKKRFWSLVNLPEFIVICVEDTVGDEVLARYESGGYEWLRKGEQYIVVDSRESFEGYSFTLKKKDGQKLFCPEPLDGFSSTRFVPADYAQFN